MSKQQTELLKQVAKRIVAVSAEGGAAAFFPAAGAALLAGTPGVGALILGCWAACLIIKNEALGAVGAESQPGVQALLATLVAEHKSLQKALEALDTDQHMHELVSRERLEEVRELLQLSAGQIEQRLVEHQEVLFAIARFIEEWSSTTNTALKEIKNSLDSLSNLESKITQGFNRVHDDQVLTQDQLSRLEIKLDATLGQVAEGARPAQLSADSLVAGEVLDHLSQQLQDASATVLRWETTVGLSRQHIPSEAEQTAIAALNESSSTLLILGAKGTGKSALSASVCTHAIATGFVVLAIKADRIPSDIRSEEALRRFLALSIRPRDALRMLAARRKVLLVVDQLDSVSELVDRQSERLNLLLNLIRDLSGVPNLHILAACREFDFQNDARLSTIRATEVRLTPPAWERVAQVLKSERFAPETFAEPMRELLRIPWNLNMYLRVASRGDAFGSMQGLIEAVWKKWVNNSDGPADRVVLVEEIALRMSKQEELFVPSALADQFAAARDALLRDEILVTESSGRALAFRHQTFYDYTLARLLSRGRKSLAEHVITLQDGLFVRPAMLNGLELLRDSARAAYRNEVNCILAASPRPHIRTLLIEYIAQQEEPDDFEAQLVLSLIAGGDGPLILRAAAGSRGWFVRLQRSGDLAKWMTRGPTEAALCVNLLIAAVYREADVVYQLIYDHWALNPEYDRHVEAVVNQLPEWNDAWANLACAAARRSSFAAIGLAERIVSNNPRVAVRLVRAQLDRELAAARCADEEVARKSAGQAEDEMKSFLRRSYTAVNRLITTHDNDMTYLEDIAATAPREFCEAVWPWFLDALSNTGEREARAGMYRDDYATWMAYDATPAPLVQSLHTAADKWAGSDAQAFSEFVKRTAQTDLLAAHRILGQGLAIAASRIPSDVVSYLLADRRRIAVGTHRNTYEFSEKIITAVFPHASAEDRARLEEWVITYEAFPRAGYMTWSPEDRFKFLQWNREHRLRLLRAVPEEFLSEKAKALKGLEETRFPSLRSWDHDDVHMHAIGARVTAEELAKSSEANIFNLFDELAGRGEYPHSRRDGLPPERSGGVREQAGQFGKFAEEHPDRALKMLPKFRPARPDHRSYVAAGIAGVARSSLSPERLFSAIDVLIETGFASTEFREAVASALEVRAKSGHLAPSEMLKKVEGWLAVTTEPDILYHTGADDWAQKATILFSAGGMAFGLLNGRATIFRSLSRIYSATKPSDLKSILRLVRSRVGAERNPEVCAEMMLYSEPLFSELDTIPDATEAFHALITSVPDTLIQKATISAIGFLTGYFRPSEHYEQWLGMLKERGEEHARQAYGELLFLYYARRLTDWADTAITKAIARADKSVMRGLAYGAAVGFEHAHCRARSADILCVIAESDDPELQKLIEPALIPAHDGAYLLDEHAWRLISTVCGRPSAVRQVGSQLLEAIAPSAGVSPAFALESARAVLDIVAESVADLSGPLSSAAGVLTSIAMTLHRQYAFRSEGLALFERLQALGLREAAAALELLDRKPNQQFVYQYPIRRHRRRRPKRAAE
jgi:hypothetical protein